MRLGEGKGRSRGVSRVDAVPTPGGPTPPPTHPRSALGWAALQVTIASGSSAPSIPAGQVRYVVEGAGVGTPVGPPLTASANGGPTLEFSLAPPTWLTIHPGTGQLMVARPGLDFEGVPVVLEVVVTVSNSILTSSVAVTVVVTDVDEPPVCSLPLLPWRVVENTAGATVVGSLSCLDQDAGSARTYAVVRAPPPLLRTAARLPLGGAGGCSRWPMCVAQKSPLRSVCCTVPVPCT
jgi:hypothetical protein